MGKFKIFLFSIFISACSSTENSSKTATQNYNEELIKEQLRSITSTSIKTETKNYEEIFLNYSEKSKLELSEINVAEGKILFLKYHTGGNSYQNIKDSDFSKFLATNKSTFENFCNGVTKSSRSIKRDIEGGDLEPLKHFNKNDAENFISASAILQYMYYYTPSVKKAVFDELGFKHGTLQQVSGAYDDTHFQCFEDGILVGSFFLVNISEIIPNGYRSRYGYSDLVVGKTTHLGMFYFPKATLSNHLNSLVNKANEHVAKDEKRRKERESKRLALQEHNNHQKAIWDARIADSYSNGDKVCTFDNLMGYVEDSNASNVKVMVVGRADRDDGAFFGNSKYLSESFRVTKMNETQWFKRTEVARCDYSID